MVAHGADYSFTRSEDAACYDYGPVTAQVDEEIVGVKENEDGSYTVESLFLSRKLSAEATEDRDLNHEKNRLVPSIFPFGGRRRNHKIIFVAVSHSSGSGRRLDGFDEGCLFLLERFRSGGCGGSLRILRLADPPVRSRFRRWVLPGGLSLLALVSAVLFSRAKGGFLLLYNDFS